MEKSLEWNVEYLCESHFSGGQGHTLLYGKPDQTLEVLKEIYQRIKAKNEFLCTWHDASAITKPMDFFEPILRLKYGEEYNSLKEKSWFKDYVARDEMSGVFQLARFCGKDEDPDRPNTRKMPVIFIDGIEELFFKMDYGHLNKKDLKRVLNGKYMNRPLSRGFGNCLRGHLHQAGTGIFYGRVRDDKGMQYQTTLGNYDYLFYRGNFREFEVREN